MKFNKEVDKELIINLYYENKELVLPIFSIVVSFFLFAIFIAPQVLSFPARRTEIAAETLKLNKIKDSEKILSTANVDLINSQVQIVENTFPDKKEFENVLNAISAAANLSNTQIDSYQFQGSKDVKTTSGSFPSLSFQVNILGDLDQTISFVDQLYKTFPISDVTSIANADNLSTISINFFYSPFSTMEINDRTQIRSMSANEKSTMDKITKWNDSFSGELFNALPPSTASAETNSPF